MVGAAPIYDGIGRAYARHRRPDPRIAAQIERAMGDVSTIVDVGAGTGSYEPGDKSVVAVEPSGVMAAQRDPGAAPVVRAVAESLPFADQSFDAALAVFTIHHWRDLVGGLREMGRVARAVVVLTFDPVVHADFWLFRRLRTRSEHAGIEQGTGPRCGGRGTRGSTGGARPGFR